MDAMLPREKYEEDPHYRAAVEVMLNLLMDSRLTTDDIAQAAVLAAQLYAEQFCAPVTIVYKGREDGRIRGTLKCRP